MCRVSIYRKTSEQVCDGMEFESWSTRTEESRRTFEVEQVSTISKCYRPSVKRNLEVHKKRYEIEKVQKGVNKFQILQDIQGLKYY